MSDVTPTRRDFLRTAAAGAAGLALAAPAAARAPLALGKAKSCVFINMVGGPAHLDTFDPKPDAPSDVRGPFSPIRTKVPGVHLSELFPKLATLTDKFTLIRSMHHDAPPVHECGFQLLNTGCLFRDGPEWPNAGAVVSHLTGLTRWFLANDSSINTGISVSHGLGSGWLNGGLSEVVDPGADLTKMLSTATRLVTFKSMFLTINQFTTVFDSPSWDCHADGGSLRTNLNDIRDTVAPPFD